MASRSAEILVVGAGPTGLVLALWLNRLGVRVRIVDRAAGTGQASRALAVQARTLEHYRAFGLSEVIIAKGVPAQAVNLWVRGRRRGRVPIASGGEDLSPFPFALILAQDIHERILLHRLEAEGVDVDWETELVDFSEGANGISARLRLRNGEIEEQQADYLCGCDGARSTVRQTLGIDFPGGTYSQVFYVADVEATGKTVDGELHVSLEENDFCLLFPMNGESSSRLVGVVDNPAADDENLAYGEVGGHAEQALGLTVGQVNWFSTYHVHHRVADSFRRGKVFLLGDAAHIHSPAGGQGMNTGIGDAINLAWKLAMVVDGRAADTILQTYEIERIAFARRLVRTTDQGFRAAVGRSWLAKFIRMRVVPALLPTLSQWRALWRTAFRTVSQLSVNYRDSPLSQGRSGTLRGGDRLPWLSVGGTDNFEPLRSLDWQIHVYGPAEGALADWCAARGIKMHVFTFGSEARRAGFSDQAAYLVRPDGYIACTGDKGNPSAFTNYLSMLGFDLSKRREGHPE